MRVRSLGDPLRSRHFFVGLAAAVISVALIGFSAPSGLATTVRHVSHQATTPVVEGEISGKVTKASDSSPVVGATVYVRDSQSLLPVRSTVTDASGRYAVTGLVDRLYYVVASAPDLAIPRPGYSSALVSNGISVAGVDFAMVPSARITGVVRDSSGNPMPGATVYALDKRSDGQNSNSSWIGFDFAFTDQFTVPLGVTELKVPGPGVAFSAADGSYTIDGLLPGTYLVRAAIPGHRSPLAATLTVADAVDLHHDVTFAWGYTIVGRVLDASGQGRAGVRVLGFEGGFAPSFHNDSDLWWFEAAPMSAITDAQGFYSITGLMAGDYGVIEDNGDPSPAAYTDFTVDAAHPRVVHDLRALTGPGRLYGLITDDSGQPAAHFTFAVMQDNFSDTPIPWVTTDASGHYSISGLPNGPWTVFGFGSGPYIDSLDDPIFEVSDAQLSRIHENVPFNFTVHRASRVEGIITDPNGHPVVGAQIDATSPSDQGEDWSGPGGLYQMNYMQPGTYSLTVEVPGFAEPRAATLTIPGWGQDVRADLQLLPLSFADVPSTPCIRVIPLHEALWVRDCGYRSDGGNPVTSETFSISPKVSTCESASTDGCVFWHLKDGTSYIVRARLYNEVGGSPITTMTQRTLLTSGPTIIRTDPVPGGVNIVFKASRTTETIVGYSVKIRVGNRGAWATQTYGTTSPLRLRGLRPNTKYSAAVVPILKSGAEANATELQFTTG